ncbi:glycosyltransferase family 2 protein [Dehalococcoidales bacterium]|nr:glycosyltransferase family 2 protein [Dehalococcoidales bacterium]
MDKENPKVSVIICAYTMERLRDIQEAVQSVLAQTLKPYEVIIAVDNNEELFQELKTGLPPEVKVVLNKGAQGLSETRNVGIRAATSEITAFIDDDAVAERDWLENLTGHFHEPMVVAVGGRAIPLWLNGSRPSWFPEELDWIVGCTYKGLPNKSAQNSEFKEVRNVHGCNMAFRKEVFKKVGLWQSKIGAVGQKLKGGEEAELCLRIKAEMPKALIIYEPNALIRHKVPLKRLNLAWLIKNSFDQGICKAKVQKLHNLVKKTLSTENSYLRYLLLSSLPERLRRFYKKESLLQAGAIIISIAAVGMGYLMESLLIKEDIRGIY